MPTPSSISRDTSRYDVTDYSSILGKRERDLSADAPNRKRPATFPSPSPPPAERPDDKDSNVSSPSSLTASDVDEPKGIESGSKPKSTKATDYCPQSSSATLAKRKHVFATHRILRRHSLSSLYAGDNCGAASRGKYHEGVALNTTCLPQARRYGFPSVYRISCSEKGSKHHRTFLFEDDPAKAIFTDPRQSSHLSGNKPIYQLRDYVKQFQQTSFVIVQNRVCDNRSAISFGQRKYDETMIILSDNLRQAIQKVATCPIELDSGMEVSKDKLLEMGAPYLFLYHHREPLRVYSRSAVAPLRTMIDAVLEYLDNNYAHEYAEATELISRGKITIRHLDKLYQPNQVLVNKLGPLGTPLESQSLAVLRHWPVNDGKYLNLSYWSWHFDGYDFERAEHQFGYSLPVGEAEPLDIDKLAYYPASFLSKESIELLRNRGKAYWSLRLPNFVYYDAKGYGSRADPAKAGRYMIDCEMHRRLHPTRYYLSSDEKVRNKQTDPWRVNINAHDEPENDEFLVMANKIPAYDFFEKEWVDLSVSNIKPIKWNKQAYEDLVLPEATKRLVKALVMTRASSIKKQGEDANFDIISGKGNGLIMLFHGSPGTGKTLTAESVADITEMPLYPITCGDLGTEPDKVEQYLRLVFQLGKRWNCVLLLDEADVFLEERTLTDLQRNSLVSVFLRMLEYYEGILILTSNRVGIFDEAFRSRIHVALHYEDLKPRSRKQIWSNFLTRLEDTEEGENVVEIRDRIDELARYELNGREIRNALSTARQLASHGGEKMRWEHLELAIQTANNFGKYLKDVHGHSDREWARETSTR